MGVVAAQPLRGDALGSRAVALSGVRITFAARDRGRQGFTAVENVDLAVADGEFVAIVGPTGCGKSTLLNASAGLLTPSAGTVSIFGAPLAGLNRQAGYLFQAEALFPWKTALDNVAIGLEVAGVATARPASAPATGSAGSGSRPSPSAIRTCSPADSGSASASPRC